MTSQNSKSLSISETCAKVKHLGYGASAHLRPYGEDFYVVSDPFPEAGRIAVRVTTKKDSAIRVLRLPATVLQRISERTTNAA